MLLIGEMEMYLLHTVNQIGPVWLEYMYNFRVVGMGHALFRARNVSFATMACG